MPWNDQGGTPDPWKQGGQGPWGQNGNGQNNPPPPQNNNGLRPPDFNDQWRQLLQRLRYLIPGSDFSLSGFAALILLGIIIWGLTGFYSVGPNQIGINRVFGRYTGKTLSGLNYNWPYPVGTIEKLNVTDRNSIDIGVRNRASTSSEALDESLMLTGDLNIADVKFRVIWQIDPAHPELYAFTLDSPAEAVKAVSESAMREVVGHSEIIRILTAERKNIEPAVQDLIQNVLNQYHAGILILQVQLLSVDPPAQVIAAFKDVTAAQQDSQRMSNEAESYANRVVPEARGAVAAVVQRAEGVKAQLIADAKGQAALYTQIYEQYKKAPEVTRQRLYLESMERILGASDKVIIQAPPGSGPVPYYSLNNELKTGERK